MEDPGFEWFRFYNGGDGYGVVSKPVCRIPRSLAGEIGASGEQVFIGLNYVRKSVNKQRMPFDHFPMMEMAIRFGDVFTDGRDLSFFYRDRAAIGSLFFVAIKSTSNQSELWVKTFHRKRAQEQRRITRRMRIIRIGPN